jgi:integrase
MTPFTPDQAALVRAILRSEHDNLLREATSATIKGRARLRQRQALGIVRDLALFDTAIDTMLRACDLLALRVRDVTDHTGAVVDEFTVRQRKTGNGHLATLLAHTRQSLSEWITAAAKTPDDCLFTSIGNRNYGGAISREQYANLVKRWAHAARLDHRRHSTHSMRRSKPAAVYDQTHNLAACQHLLAHKSIGSTAHYLGVDQRKALDLAKRIKV